MQITKNKNDEKVYLYKSLCTLVIFRDDLNEDNIITKIKKLLSVYKTEYVLIRYNKFDDEESIFKAIKKVKNDYIIHKVIMINTFLKGLNNDHLDKLTPICLISNNQDYNYFLHEYFKNGFISELIFYPDKTISSILEDYRVELLMRIYENIRGIHFNDDERKEYMNACKIMLYHEKENSNDKI